MNQISYTSRELQQEVNLMFTELYNVLELMLKKASEKKQRHNYQDLVKALRIHYRKFGMSEALKNDYVKEDPRKALIFSTMIIKERHPYLEEVIAKDDLSQQQYDLYRTTYKLKKCKEFEAIHAQLKSDLSQNVQHTQEQQVEGKQEVLHEQQDKALEEGVSKETTLEQAPGEALEEQLNLVPVSREEEALLEKLEAEYLEEPDLRDLREKPDHNEIKPLSKEEVLRRLSNKEIPDKEKNMLEDIVSKDGELTIQYSAMIQDRFIPGEPAIKVCGLQEAYEKQLENMKPKTQEQATVRKLKL